MSVSDAALAAVVAVRRVAHGVGPRHSFTVERSEARLRLRDRPGHGAWDWTLVLVRGLLALVDAAEVDAVTRSADGLEVLELTVGVDASALDGYQPGMILDEALAPDPGPGDGSLEQRQTRLRRLSARAFNEALAERPRQLELVTPVGTRVLARDERKSGDPYRESGTSERSEPGTLKVRLTLERGISRWIDALMFNAEGLFTPIIALWQTRVPGLVRRPRGARLRALPEQPFIALGRHARLWPSPAPGLLKLLRDGVSMIALDPVLLESGLSTNALAGLLECPRLRLTVDETNVVRDEAVATLVGWLADAIARGRGEPLQSVAWPEHLSRVSTAAGTVVEVASLLAHVRAEARELPYVAPAQADTLPLATRSHVLALSPSELDALQREQPELALVPASAVLGASPGERADLTALAQGSLPALALPVPPWSAGGEESIAVELVAYLHRHGVAARGSVMLIARDRTVARGVELDASLPGVTLVARLPASPATTALVADQARQRALAQWVAAQGLAQRDAMLAHLVAQRSDPTSEERIPLLRAAIDGLDARALGLRYQLDAGVARLGWREHPLGALVIAHTRGEAPRTLAAALVRAREVGGIVLGERARRWYVLETDDEAHATWVPTPRGRELLTRVLGDAGLWEMPTVPPGHAHPLPAAEQRVLLLDRDEAARQLARTSGDVHARDALLAHLLVARALGSDELGLRDVPLLSVFDPDAVQPARLRSLASVLADDRVHAVVPIGTATRDLPGPVIEAAPGIAALLHEVVRAPLQAVVAERRRAPVPSTPSATRRVASEPVLRHPITDGLAAGALQLVPGSERRGVDLWARGLRIGELELPSPLGDVGGRLWLSDAGVRAGRPAIEQMLLRHARALVLAAQQQAELAPPGGARRLALERFVAHCQATALAGDDRLGLRATLASPAAAAVLSANAASAARLPPLRRLWLPALVRHALGHAAKLETAWLSWKLASIADPVQPIWQIELGGRHRWINRAERDDSSAIDVQLAALAVAAEVLATVGAPRAAIAAAMLRVIATAHVSART